MHFLIDENLPLSLAAAFENYGHSVQHVRSLTELRGQSDEVIFEYAATRKLIIVTRDLNFANPLRFNLGKLVGMVVLRFSNDISMEQMCQNVGESAAELSEEQWHNLIVIEPGSVRLRGIK